MQVNPLLYASVSSGTRGLRVPTHIVAADPQIPFIPALTPVTPYGEPDMCYDMCDLVQRPVRTTDNCTTGYSDSDCDRQRSSTASPHQQREVRQNMVTMNTTTSKKQSPHILPVDQVADDDAEADDSSIEALHEAEDDVDDELENSSTLTTETVTRLKDGVRDKS